MKTSSFVQVALPTAAAQASRLPRWRAGALQHGSRALGLAVVFAAASATLAGCGPSAAATDPRSFDQLIQVSRVTSATAHATAFSGVVSARVQSNLGFRVSGKVVERLVDTGQAVHQGQPLMRLDRTDYMHAISAQAGSVESARARALQTAADEARFKRLLDSGAVSRSDYDRAKEAADSARALLSAAEAQLKVARDEGAYSTLLADADGVVVDTDAEPGQYVSAGQIVVRLARAGPREASVSLPETLRPALGSEATVTLYGQADDAAVYTAHLRQISDAADPLTRTYEARYVLDGAAAMAPLGATVTVRLRDSVPDELEVPLGAVDDEGGGPGVWVYDSTKSTVSFRSVRIARFDSEHAVVSGELHAGDPVVALGGHLLHDGQRVRADTARIASN